MNASHHSDTPRTNSVRIGPDHKHKYWEDFARELERENADLRAQLDTEKTRANFHRERGITLLDAKWLDPICHQGCHSLVLKSERDALAAQVAVLRDAMEKIRVGYLGQTDKGERVFSHGTLNTLDAARHSQGGDAMLPDPKTQPGLITRPIPSNPASGAGAT